MAKESMKAREVKRAKMVAKYAEKRAALKEIVRKGEPADAFEAAQKLQDLPKNANPYPFAQPLQTDRTSKRIYPSVRHFTYSVP